MFVGREQWPSHHLLKYAKIEKCIQLKLWKKKKTQRKNVIFQWNTNNVSVVFSWPTKWDSNSFLREITYKFGFSWDVDPLAVVKTTSFGGFVLNLQMRSINFVLFFQSLKQTTTSFIWCSVHAKPFCFVPMNSLT